MTSPLETQCISHILGAYYLQINHKTKLYNLIFRLIQSSINFDPSMIAVLSSSVNKQEYALLLS